MPDEQTLSAYEPRSWREQLAYTLMGGDNPSLARRHFVQGLLGTTGLGQRTTPNVADAIPGAAGLLQMQEAYPNQVEMAKSTLGFMPPSPYGLLGGQANNIRSLETAANPNDTYARYASFIRSLGAPANTALQARNYE